MPDFKLDERSRMVLNAVIKAYIASADPVGSRTLWKKCNLGFSPATLRNIMADLEDMGLLQHPYTSAGRVPTDLGYRIYVDSLAKHRRWHEAQLNKLKEVYKSLEEDTENLFAVMCRLLSVNSQYIGVLLAPRLKDTVFKQVKFIRLRENQVLVVFVSQAGMAQQRVIEIEEPYTQDKLDQMARCLNDNLKGMPLYQVRKRLMSMMARDKDLYDRLLRDAIELSKEMLAGGEEGNVYIEGKLNILKHPEFADIEKMKAIFQAFEEKDRIVQILDDCLNESGVQILIGSETAAEQMRDCSLVTAPYMDDDRIVGRLGVIGPTRMNYSQVIPLVEYAAKLLNELLSNP